MTCGYSAASLSASGSTPGRRPRPRRSRRAADLHDRVRQRRHPRWARAAQRAGPARTIVSGALYRASAARRTRSARCAPRRTRRTSCTARPATAASWRRRPRASGPTASSTADSSSTCPGATLVSSEPHTPDGAAPRQLGRFLTGTEAERIADRLADGRDSLTAALRVVNGGRRTQVRQLLTNCGLGSTDLARGISVLRAVEGAYSTVRAIDPLWTMPGPPGPGTGPLTGPSAKLVDGARQSVTCSTFNFATSSVLWQALPQAASRTRHEHPGLPLTPEPADG